MSDISRARRTAGRRQRLLPHGRTLRTAVLHAASSRAIRPFAAILAQGLLSGRERLLDLGCGQGLLAAWLLAARSCHASERAGALAAQAGRHRRDFASYAGIEINAQEVRACAARVRARYRRAACRSCTADIRDVDYGSPADAVVILDVLHYLDYASQERILARVRAALAPGGCC